MLKSVVVEVIVGKPVQLRVAVNEVPEGEPVDVHATLKEVPDAIVLLAVGLVTVIVGACTLKFELEAELYVAPCLSGNNMYQRTQCLVITGELAWLVNDIKPLEAVKIPHKSYSYLPKALSRLQSVY